MARAFWKGAVTFGMMSVPIRLYKAQDDDRSAVAMRVLCPCHEQPVKQPRRCAVTDGQLLETRSGFDTGAGKFVLFDDSELEGLNLASVHTIELEQFIVPPGRSAMGLYAQGSYYLEPEPAGAKAYLLLRMALESSNKWGVGKIALRGRERLCVVQAHGQGLILTTIAWPDAIRAQGELNLPDATTVHVSDQELGMAQSFIAEMTSPFEPGAYHDEYAVAFQRLVNDKVAAGLARPVDLHPAPAKPGKAVPDIMESLKASVEAAKAKKRVKVPA